MVGFSVDYVLHIGHMLMEAKSHCGLLRRNHRVQFALERMGSSVVAGAMTTGTKMMN